MKYFFVITFITVYLCCPLSLGYTASSPLYTHFTYMFQHAGAWHLLLNSIAFTGIFGAMEKLLDRRLATLASIACAFAASFVSARDLPTVGASAIIYSMIGLFFGATAFCSHIRIADTRKFRLFVLSVVISLTVSYFKANSNFTLHVACLATGFPTALLFAVKRKRSGGITD